MWYSHALQQASFGVPEGPRAGMLFDETGMGKTVSVLALMLAQPAPTSLVAGDVVRFSDGRTALSSRATLIVCPPGLVDQWVSEVQTKLANSGELVVTAVKAGSPRPDVQTLAHSDVVVAALTLVRREFSDDLKQAADEEDGGGGRYYEPPPPPPPQYDTCGPTTGVAWYRVVFDESQGLKDAQSMSCKAAARLLGDRRWSCSGTPVSTDADATFSEFRGHMRALQMSPLAGEGFARIAYSCDDPTAYTRPAVSILRGMVVRHTKRHLDLPPITHERVDVILGDVEWRVYVWVWRKAVAIFRSYLDRGGAEFCASRVLSLRHLLMPLRRLCAGGRLRVDGLRPSTRLRQAAAAAMAAGGAPAFPPADGPPYAPDDEDECPICHDDYADPVRTACAHWFCGECILTCLEANPKCPMCRQDVDATTGLFRAVFEEADAAAADAAAEAEAGGDADALPETLVADAKADALVAHLEAMRERDPTSKALVFTQFVDSMAVFEERLVRAGVQVAKVKGGATHTQKRRALERFRQDPDVRVLLAATRTAAVGLNLTEADHVFIMDPLTDAKLDVQAYSRAWRIGQRRPLTVKRFVALGTIEAAVMAVREPVGDYNDDHDADAGDDVGEDAGDEAVADDDGDRAGPSTSAPRPPAGGRAPAVSARERKRAEKVEKRRVAAEARMRELSVMFAPPEVPEHLRDAMGPLEAVVVDDADDDQGGDGGEDADDLIVID